MKRLFGIIALWIIPYIVFGYNYSISGSVIINDDKIYDNAYLIGAEVRTYNDIHGDVYIGSINTNVSSIIKNDLLINSINTSIDQATYVYGDMRIISANMIINPTTVSGEMILAGINIDIKPHMIINGDTLIIGENIIVSGEYNGNVEIHGKHIKILPQTKIKGNLIYSTENEISDISKYVDGNIKFNKTLLVPNTTQIKETIGSYETYIKKLSDIWFVWNIIGTALLIFIIYIVFPTLFERTIDYIKTNTGYAYIAGFLFIFIGGILSILCIIINIPIGIFLLNSWSIFTFLAYDIVVISFAVSLIVYLMKIKSKLKILAISFILSTIIKFLFIWILNLSIGIFIVILMYFALYMLILGAFTMVCINHFKS